MTMAFEFYFILGFVIFGEHLLSTALSLLYSQEKEEDEQNQ